MRVQKENEADLLAGISRDLDSIVLPFEQAAHVAVLRSAKALSAKQKLQACRANHLRRHHHAPDPCQGRARATRVLPGL